MKMSVKYMQREEIVSLYNGLEGCEDINNIEIGEDDTIG